MHYSIFPIKTAWISSGSNDTTGTTERDQNFGRDQILELKKEFFNNSFHYQTRVLLQFDLNETGNSITQSILNGSIPKPHKEHPFSSSFYLKLYEAKGNQELSSDYKIHAYALSQSWDEGIGKFGDVPKVTNGVSWENKQNLQQMTAVSWSNVDGTRAHGGNYLTESTVSNHNTYEASQSFSNESADINMDVTNIVRSWLSGVDNNGIILKFSGSQETDNTTTGKLKFFSRHTNTIFAPKLEVRWDDHETTSGSYDTGSLFPLTMSRMADNYVYPIGMKESYKEDERVKFRFGARKRYIQKTFSTSVQTVTGSYIPEGSGSYSIVDIASGETIVPFSPYTTMSCDPNGNYFIQWLNTFSPDRIYKILIQLKYPDGQRHIFDDNFEFKIRR